MNYKKIEASGELVLPAGVTIYGLRLESTSDDCTAIVYDEATQALGASEDREICTLFVTNEAAADKHPSADRQDFQTLGLYASKGISVTLSGTSVRLYVYYA